MFVNFKKILGDRQNLRKNLEKLKEKWQRNSKTQKTWQGLSYEARIGFRSGKPWLPQ